MVAMVSLEDQGALVVESRSKVSAVEGTRAEGRNILEVEVLRFFQKAGTTHPKGVYADPAVRRAVHDMRVDLIERGLLAKRWDLLGNGRVAPLIVTLATLYGIVAQRAMPLLAFYLPWQVLCITGVAVLVIALVSSVLSIRRVLVLEPAIVFQGGA